MQYFYHGTDPIRLVKIRKSGLCHGLRADERKFGKYLTSSLFNQDGIYLTERFGVAVRFASAAHNPEFGVRGYQRERRHEKEPGAIIRFEQSEIPDRCTISTDPIIERAIVLRCPEKCIRPKAEICFIPEAEILAAFRPRAPLDFGDNPDSKADKISCKWKPLRWAQ